MTLDSYSVECSGCGAAIRVQLYEAGTRRTCPGCSATIAIPSSIVLKQRAGDAQPFWNARQKLESAISHGTPPFDGTCHGCRQATATFRTNCVVCITTERAVSHEGGVRLSVTGGIKLQASTSIDSIERLIVPLLLCDACQTQFRREYFRSRIGHVAGLLTILGLFGAFLYAAFEHSEVVASLSGFLTVLGTILWIASFRFTSAISPSVRKWLSRIPLVSEALLSEDEIRIYVQRTERLSA